MRVIEGREDLRLALEAGDPGGVVRHGRRQHFDGDVPAEFDVTCSVHFAHSAGTDARDDFGLAEPSSYKGRMAPTC